MNSLIKNKKLMNLMAYWTAVGAGTFILVFIITSSIIGFEVKDRCQMAKARYFNEDCVSALILTLEDEQNSFVARNDAIWALGQMGDRAALPVLESHYTGNIPDMEPYDRTLSQYELKKAIDLINGGFNATAIFWRNNDQP